MEEEEVNVTLEDLNEFFDQPDSRSKNVSQSATTIAVDAPSIDGVSVSETTIHNPLFLNGTTAPTVTQSDQSSVQSNEQMGESLRAAADAPAAAESAGAEKMSLRPRARLLHSEINSKQPRKSLADLLSEYNSTKLNAHSYMDENDVLDLDQLDLPKNPADYSEQQLETVLATKMREYRISILREYGPYSSINLQELLNPADRLESIVLYSARRHGMNNLHLDSLVTNAIKMIETEQQFIRRLNVLGKTLQNDDPDWPGPQFDDGDVDVIKARCAVQEWLFNDIMYVEKMQQIRDRVTYIYDKKMELLRILKERFGHDSY